MRGVPYSGQWMLRFVGSGSHLGWWLGPVHGCDVGAPTAQASVSKGSLGGCLVSLHAEVVFVK